MSDDPAEAVARLNAERAPFYAEVADLVIDVDDLGAAEVARRVVDAVVQAQVEGAE